MITSMHIENFKCFKNFDIELGPFNVLIGPNDSGKTAFLQAIQLAGLVSEMNLTEFRPISLVQDDLVKLEVGSKESWPWQCDKNNIIRIEMKADAIDALDDCRRAFTEINISNDTIKGSEELLLSNHNGLKSQNWNRNAIGKIDYFHLDPVALRRRARISDPFLANGEGLPILIQKIETSDQFQGEFRSQFSYYEEIRNKVVKEDQKDFLIIEIVTNYDKTLLSDSVSDGVMLSLAFLALKHTRKDPGHHIFLIEEPENCVHHLALKEIVATLSHLSKQEGIQVILTTHSPYLLDLVEPEDVRVFQKDDEGAVHAVKLSDFPDAEEMRKHFGAGEIWTAFDERKIVETVRGKK